MSTLQHPYTYTSNSTRKSTNLFTQLIGWCKSQEQYRFGWLAAIVAGHGCLITPLTLLFIMFSGGSLLHVAFAIAAMTMALVTNLAALPTKITIPVFFLSIFIDVVIVINCVFLIGMR